jgi:peptidoglycan/LPS O-acetylase OafA/YrhL
MTRRIAGLDLLRGLAIALVMLRHALPDLAPGAGVVGVVMFFTVSGFLITGVLVDEHARTGRVNLRRFYRHRARRLVPALVALVFVVVLVTVALDPLGDRDDLVKTVVVALTWTGNLPFGHASDATFHLWTLATEEQFYLVWPALLLVLGPRRGLFVAASGTAAALVATVLWLRDEPDLAYALPTTWAICFVVGAASRLHRDRLVVPTWAPPVVLAGVAVLSVVPLRGQALTYLAGGPAIAALTAVLLLAWRTWTEVMHPALRVLVWLGTLSYGAYLWNYPLTIWLRPHMEHGAGLVAAGLTLLAAAASWYAVERPLQRRATREVVAQ